MVADGFVDSGGEAQRISAWLTEIRADFRQCHTFLSTPTNDSDTLESYHNSLFCVECVTFHSRHPNSIIIAIMTVIITIMVIVFSKYICINTYVVYRSSCVTMWEACLDFAIAKCFALWFPSMFLPCSALNLFFTWGLWDVIKIIHWQTDDGNRNRSWKMRKKSGVFAPFKCYDGLQRTWCVKRVYYFCLKHIL